VALEAKTRELSSEKQGLDERCRLTIQRLKELEVEKAMILEEKNHVIESSDEGVV